jgi:hypothetical protein
MSDPLRQKLRRAFWAMVFTTLLTVALLSAWG